MPVYTLFGQQAVAGTAADATAYTLGVQFSVNVAGSTLGAIWFFSPSAAVVLPSTIALFTVGSPGTLITSQAASWSGAVTSGWVRAAWAAPLSLTSGTSYKACVFQGTAVNWYNGSTPHYWDTGAGSGGITNGPLTAPNNTGASPGQDSFHQSAALSYPDTSFNASNYWIDPEITTPSAVAATRDDKTHVKKLVYLLG